VLYLVLRTPGFIHGECQQTLQKYYECVPFERIERVVLDEAHNCLSQNRVLMIRYIEKAGCLISGFSATPSLNVNRPEGDLGLLSVYELLGFDREGEDSPIERFTITDAITCGALMIF